VFVYPFPVFVFFCFFAFFLSSFFGLPSMRRVPVVVQLSPSPLSYSHSLARVIDTVVSF
jgi:hypothetical protein